MGNKTDLKGTCANCKNVNCIDLFRHTKDEDNLVGGELYIYRLIRHSGEEKLCKYICYNGNLIQCACFIVSSAYSMLPEGEYLPIVSNEIVRDMKTSFYLAMSGHYRQAILIQRCVFENFLYGLYFAVKNHHLSLNDQDRKNVQKEFDSWVSGSTMKISYLLKIIEKAGDIDEIEKTDWQILYHELSLYVHTILKTPTGKKIQHGNIEIPGCYSVVEYSEKDLIEWSNFYQRLMFLILHRLLTGYPFIKRTDAGRLALQYIRGSFKGMREELNNTYLDAILKMRSGKSIEA